jgi:hypothetical protein
MRMTRWIATALFAAVLGCGASGSSNSNSDGGATTPNSDGGTTTPAGPEQLTAFARNLIETKTSDDSTPAEVASLTFADDTEDPNAFPPAFFL